MSHAYTEDQLVEQPAIDLFAGLGWQTVSAMEEVFGSSGMLGWETPREWVLVCQKGGLAPSSASALPHCDRFGLFGPEVDHPDVQELRAAVSLL